MEQLIDGLMKKFFIELEASGRHVHLTAQAAVELFGHALTEKRDLSQPGQFVCNERVSLIGPKGRIDNVAVLGPERSKCQAELSATDCVKLGLAPVVRLSGDVQGAPTVKLEVGGKQITSPAIVAQRHIHMTPADARLRGLSDGQTVKLRTLTARPVTFENVTLRVSDQFATYAHLDFDEANACGYQKGDLGLIV